MTKSADVEEAAPGDTITYTVEVAPNVSPEDLTYTITDTLPEGTTYVEGSATDGATFANGVVSWEGVLPATLRRCGHLRHHHERERSRLRHPAIGALGSRPRLGAGSIRMRQPPVTL